MGSVYKSILSELVDREIIELALRKREDLRIGFDIPIANDIFMLLEKLNIILVEYPVQNHGEIGFSAMLLCIQENNMELSFIGLNSADYFDKQVFAIAHELYHFWIKDYKAHLSRFEDTQMDLTEAKADRFSAEFLLPKKAMEDIIRNDFKTIDLRNVKIPSLLRFIARVHCVWWLPYKSIVKRLFEVKSISGQQYELLYSIDERSPDSEYYQIGIATDKDSFSKLNEQTKRIGTAAKYIEETIRNFEEGIINESDFVKVLRLFDKNPEDFGFDFNINENDAAEFAAYFQGVAKDENRL
jgi:Zn-dependent peptidase ImmA (M78 family)